MARKRDPAHVITDKLIEEMEKKISAEYATAHKEVKEKLEDYLRRFTSKDKVWRRWVTEGKKTAEEYREWVTGQVMMGKRWEQLKDALADDYLKAHNTAEKIVNGYRASVYAENVNYATYEVETGTHIDTSYTLYNRDAVERMWRDDPKIYKRPGAKIQQAIRDGQLKKWNRQQVQSVMMQGILQGESIPQLAKRLEKVTGGEHKAAIRNARTMMTGIQNAARMDGYQRAEDMGIKTKKVWVAYLDSRTRHWHRELDGVTLPLKEPFKNEYGKIMYPGDTSADGANIYNCRCTLIRSRKGFEIDVTDMSLRDTSKLGGMTYEEWKAEKKSTSLLITHQERVGNAIKGAWIRKYMNG